MHVHFNTDVHISWAHRILNLLADKCIKYSAMRIFVLFYCSPYSPYSGPICLNLINWMNGILYWTTILPSDTKEQDYEHSHSQCIHQCNMSLALSAQMANRAIHTNPYTILRRNSWTTAANKQRLQKRPVKMYRIGGAPSVNDSMDCGHTSQSSSKFYF